MAWDNGQTNSEYKISLKCWQDKQREATDLIRAEVDKIEQEKNKEILRENKSLFSRMIGFFKR
jgi:hypothetical protein|tara:strand:- start:472 stop:660 length:189 start_codon:yes stop_codon:yes gene_type:complete